MNKPVIKSAILFFSILSIVSITLAFAVLQHDDGEDRVNFSLIDHNKQRVTHKNYAGRHQLVFFGFTSCEAVCPLQMNKLSKVMYHLESNGYANQVTPILISVDPERDTPEKMAEYLTFFHNKFVGLTGSRVALKSTADSFKTLLSKAPEKLTKNYQITHSSVVYLLDPFNRIIDYIPFSQEVDGMLTRIQQHL